MEFFKFCVSSQANLPFGKIRASGRIVINDKQPFVVSRINSMDNHFPNRCRELFHNIIIENYLNNVLHFISSSLFSNCFLNIFQTYLNNFKL